MRIRKYSEQDLSHLDANELKKEYVTLLNAYQKLENRMNKILKISDSFESQIYQEKKQSDINAQRLQIESEAATLASQMKSEFLAHMSHEIRTPLNGIVGFISILKQQEKSEEKFHYLDIIDRSSQSLLSIINDILDFSKIETGNLSQNEHNFNPKEEFKTIGALFQANASEKEVNLILNLSPNLPDSLYSDSVKLKQVIGNLLSNAIKFTPKHGEVILSISYEPATQLLSVGVKDSGIGIPEDKQAEIFEAYTQASADTHRHYGGTGLGLAISYRLVEILGGKLMLSSQENVGSEFYFSVKTALGDSATDKSQLEQLTFHQQHVLVADDHPMNQLLLTLILEQMNLKCSVASDGEEVLEMCKKEHFDLIMIDQNMPILSGIETTQKLREYEKLQGFPFTPIVAVTGDVMNDTEEKALDSGMNGYLSKPIDVKKLKEILKRLLV